MGKLKKISAYFLGVMFLLTFGGCALLGPQAPAKSPDEVLKEAAGNVFSIASGGYDFSVSGYALSSAFTTQGGTDTSIATTDERVDFNVTLNGIFDMQEKSIPKFTVKADASVKTGTELETLLGGELRLGKAYLYGMISKLESGTTEIPAETKALIGQWYKMAIPEGTFADVQLPGTNEANMTDQQKQNKALLEKSTFFKDVKYLGVENVSGVSSYHYSATIDKEGVKAFLDETAKTQGTALTEQEKADMENALNSTDLSGEVWIGAEDMIIRKVTGTMKMTLESKELMNLSISFALKDVNKAQTVEEPKEAKDFDPSLLFSAAAAMQGGATVPTVPVQ